jgi:hypothetical protein
MDAERSTSRSAGHVMTRPAYSSVTKRFQHRLSGVRLVSYIGAPISFPRLAKSRDRYKGKEKEGTARTDIPASHFEG